MVRDERWKLVHFLGQDQRDAGPVGPGGQLFDLKSDPDEFVNLWEDEAHAEKKRELLEVLLEWRLRSGIETAGMSEEWR